MGGCARRRAHMLGRICWGICCGGCVGGGCRFAVSGVLRRAKRIGPRGCGRGVLKGRARDRPRETQLQLTELWRCGSDRGCRRSWQWVLDEWCHRCAGPSLPTDLQLQLTVCLLQHGRDDEADGAAHRRHTLSTVQGGVAMGSPSVVAVTEAGTVAEAVYSYGYHEGVRGVRKTG
jgi:hypothetical protein